MSRYRNKIQFIKTLKNYKLYTTFRLEVNIYNNTIAQIINKKPSETLQESLNYKIKQYSQFSIKRIIIYLQKRQEAYLLLNKKYVTVSNYL